MSEEIIDVVIIGTGPAGLQAAIHAVRKKASVTVLGKQANSSIFKAHVENYLCIDGVTGGEDLLKIGRNQAERFGTRFLDEDVLHVEAEDDLFAVTTENNTLKTHALVIATGTSRKKLKVPGEKELTGKGVSYCVDCDANFYRNAKVAVVGDGSAAVDGAMTLTKYASEVTLITREPNVSNDMKKRLEDSAVLVRQGGWVKEIEGEHAVTGVILEDDAKIEVEGVFIELGSKGALELATSLGVMLDTETFTHIQVNRDQQTNIAGIYAAGDITGHPYQMAKAVGEGCVAGWNAANYARRKQKQE